MALASLYRVVQDLAGNIVTDVLGTVTLAGTSTLASLFSDSEGTAPLPNPLVNNPTYGSFQVYLASGLFDMSFVKAGYTFETQRSISLRDPAAGVNVLSGTANQVIVTPASGIGNVTLSTPQDLAPDSSLQFGHLGLGTPPPTGGTLLSVNGASVLSGGLTSHGPTTLNGQTEVGTGTFTVYTPATMANVTIQAGIINAVSQLVVNGPTTLNGATTIGTGILTVNASAQFGSTVGFNGTVNTASTVQIGGTGPLTVQVLSTFEQPVTGKQFSVPETGGALAAYSGALSAGANRWNLYMSGTATNFLQAPLSIGVSAPEPNCQLSIRFLHGTTSGILLRPSDADTGSFQPLVFLNQAGGVVGSISTTGEATAYNTSSDVRLKCAVETLKDALPTVRALRPVTFRWKADGTPGQGFIAQEAQAVVPEAVTGSPEDPQPTMQIDFSKLVPLLTGACQELAAQVQALTARVQQLEALTA